MSTNKTPQVSTRNGNVKVTTTCVA